MEEGGEDSGEEPADRRFRRLTSLAPPIPLRGAAATAWCRQVRPNEIARRRPLLLYFAADPATPVAPAGKAARFLFTGLEIALGIMLILAGIWLARRKAGAS